MVKKILDLDTKDIFYYIFSSYFLFGMHVSIEHVGGYGLYLPFNIIGWMFISFLIGLGLYQISKSRKLFYSNLYIYCTIGSALLLIPFFYSNNIHAHLSVMRIFGLGGGLLLYLSFQQFGFNKKEKHGFLYVILCSVLIQILLKSFFLFKPEFGAMAQKNVFATFLATGTTIALFLLLIDKNAINNIIKKILVFGIPFLSCIHIYHLESRTGYLAIILGIITIILFGDRKNKNLQLWLGLLFIGLIVGSLTKRDTITSKAKQYSGNTRMATYQLTYEMIKENPIFGVGYGNFLSAFRLHYAKRKKEDPSIETIGNNNMDHPHNEILFWTVEGGIIPLIGLLIMAGGLLIIIWRAKLKSAWGMLGLTFPVLIHTQLELPFYISLVHWVTFIFIIYMIDNEFSKQFEINVEFVSIFRILSLSIPIIISIYMATTLKTAAVITQFERTGYRDPSLLVSIGNPHAWQKKYETLIMKLNLNIAKQTRDKNKLNDYIKWAEQYIEHSPYLFIYYDLATAHEAMGNGEKAWERYRYAQHLYPGAKWRDEDNSNPY